ncbi:MAG: chemotaxis response regulator protein-glutamate methylesterase [Alphaproteobacteria bacterium]|nr:chemotaxis response regulator protein-glutamate methylesterase [Alphaproteobacteria bacterium]
MVVDDSAVIRGLITRILEEDELVDVVVTASNGENAVKALDRYDVEVIVLDIEMPVMDGLTAIPLLLEKRPGIQIVMASTLTLNNASISFKAMALGAADYVPKPTTSRDIYGGDYFKRDIREKVKALGNVCRRSGVSPKKSVIKIQEKRNVAVKKGQLKTSSLWSSEYNLLPEMTRRPDVLVIGSSTGGPQALFSVFSEIKNKVNQPILITQHMPMTFTKILAEHLEKASGLKAAEAVDGEEVVGNRIYVAPGGIHMTVEVKDGKKVIKLVDGPPENYCKPSVDPMLRSVAKVYGRKAFVSILTGMGSDGKEGGKEIVENGGAVIAQDEKTSVVWGMPGAVANANICSAVIPLSDIARYIIKVANK